MLVVRGVLVILGDHDVAHERLVRFRVRVGVGVRVRVAWGWG